MVCDSSSIAYQRMDDDYNFAGYPSTFFDGGPGVVVGGYPDQATYRSHIIDAGDNIVPSLDLRVKINYIATNTVRVNVRIGNGVPATGSPADVDTPVGPASAQFDEVVTFAAASTDADGDSLFYEFHWGDQSSTGWMGPYASGDSVYATHSWNQMNNWQVKVRCRDDWGEVTPWSPITNVFVSCCRGIRGNINNDPGDALDISDLLYLVDFMFLPPGSVDSPECLLEANVDGVGSVLPDISDLLYLVDYMFLPPGGAPGPVPCN